MSTLTIQLPDSVTVEKSDVLRMIAARLYERGTLSLGQAAELAGMAKWDFADVLGDYGVSIVNHPASELMEDLKNANGGAETRPSSSRIERLERLRGSLKEDEYESLSFEDFKAERREIWQGLAD